MTATAGSGGRTGAGDVVDDERADGAAVVRLRDRPEALLARGVPDLRLDLLAVDVDGARRKLDADRLLRLDEELVAREAAQQVRLPDGGVADEYDLEEVVVPAGSIRSCSYSKRTISIDHAIGSATHRRDASGICGDGVEKCEHAVCVSCSTCVRQLNHL